MAVGGQKTRRNLLLQPWKRRTLGEMGQQKRDSTAFAMEQPSKDTVTAFTELVAQLEDSIIR
eukprot:2912361-Amphidinium_carterae.1